MQNAGREDLTVPDGVSGSLDRIAVRRQFERFVAQASCDSSPLYDRLAVVVAQDDELIDIAAHARPGQPVPNLFLGAVQYLLFQNPDHRLAQYYPSIVSEARTDEDLQCQFREFVLSRKSEIEHLLKTRLVQTNEVRRSACLLPGIQRVFASGEERPLYLIEIGSSAGVNLLFDQYFYDYGNGQTVGPSDSPVRIACESKGGRKIPITNEHPPISERLGVDLHPIRVDDEDSLLWLRALVWPDQQMRRNLLKQAISVARKHAIRHVRGNAVELLPDLLDAVPADATACIFHSYVLNQWKEEDIRRFEEAMLAFGKKRQLYCVYIPWKATDGSELTLASFSNAGKTETVLAKCSDHGTWIDWL